MLQMMKRSNESSRRRYCIWQRQLPTVVR